MQIDLISFFSAILSVKYSLHFVRFIRALFTAVLKYGFINFLITLTPPFCHRGDICAYGKDSSRTIQG